jgi:hypothetical protein
MAVADKEMAEARRRLSRSLAPQEQMTDALSVLDKAVSGLIDLAKGRIVTDNIQAKQVENPFGNNNENPAGSDYYDTDLDKTEGNMKPNNTQKTNGRFTTRDQQNAKAPTKMGKGGSYMDPTSNADDDDIADEDND